MLPPIPAAFGYRLCKAGRSGAWLVSPLSFQCVMVLPYLSSAPPEAAKRMLRREIIQASGSLPDPWAFHPSVVLTEPHGPLPRRKSHYAVMLHSCMPEAVRHLQAGSRSCPERPSWRSPLLWLFITGSYLKNVYSVVKVLLISQYVTTWLLRVRFYVKMDVSTGMRDDPFCPKTGLYTTPSLISGLS